MGPRIQLAQPHLATILSMVSMMAGTHVVALQVAFERQTLKPVFYLIGYRLWV
jgi:hypothetical protein